jgi:hypothetical protein
MVPTRPWRMQVGAVLALVLAVGAGACSHGSTSERHALRGTYAVHGDYAGATGTSPTNGAPCRAAAVGYADIRPGAAVTVRGDGSRVLGRTVLGSGRYRLTPGFRDDCVYPFRVQVPDRPAYVIEVATRGGVRFTRADIVRAHWSARLTIGNYSLGT